jgi:hypothetical protein
LIRARPVCPSRAEDDQLRNCAPAGGQIAKRTDNAQQRIRLNGLGCGVQLSVLESAQRQVGSIAQFECHRGDLLVRANPHRVA